MNSVAAAEQISSHDAGFGSPLVPRRRRRVLVSAFAASPLRGSEPTAGWHIPLRLAAYHDVTVLASTANPGEPQRQEIEEYFRRHGGVQGLEFHFVDSPPLTRLLQRDDQNASLLRPFYYTGYAAWQRAALREARQLHAQQPFDIVHHLNISGYREPGYLWKMDVPFVWGPVGGGSNMPWSYFPQFSWKERAFYALRNITNGIQKRAKLRCRRAAQRASHIWVVSDDDKQLVRELWGRPCDHMTESAPTVRCELVERSYDGKRPLRLAWSGQHVGRKGLPIALEAVARLPDVPLELSILGQGAAMPRWQALAWKLGISDKVKWLGRLPHAQAVAAVAGADVFVFTGLQEGTPCVLPEALSMGLPVICHDACGMRYAINDDCGAKVPMKGIRASIEGFAAAIRKLANDPPELRRLSSGALIRAEELSWETKARQIAEVYERVLAERASVDN